METIIKTKWVADPTHTTIGFKIKHLKIANVKGRFDNFEIFVDSEEEHFINADITAKIDASSINTNSEKRDEHLKSAEFFHVEKYPDIFFKSIMYDGEMLIGDLTIKNNTRRIELKAEFNGVSIDQYDNKKAGFEISGEINRKDFGLNWDDQNSKGIDVLSDKLKIMIDAELVIDE